jgi:hypothetical protein
VPTSYPLHSNAGPRAPPGGFLGGPTRDDEPSDTLADGRKSYETLIGGALDLAGRPSVTIWLAYEPPTAHQVRILSIDEVLADGRTISLGESSGHLAAADSAGVAPTGPRRWEFSSFPWIARRLAAGSKLRLTVNGAATVIYHDTERYSRVILPVVRERK